MSRTRPPRSVRGLRVLVVEDDYDVAELLRSCLVQSGVDVVGPVSTAEEAVRLVKEESLDAAVLDIALSPGSSAPVALALRSRECPFVFVTGFSNLDMLPEELRGYPILLKPVDRDELAAALSDLVRDRRPQRQR